MMLNELALTWPRGFFHVTAVDARGEVVKRKRFR